MKAMILSAGLGTRLKPFTDKHPKALAVVNGKTLLQRNIEYLASFGINDVIVNVHHFADQIIDILKENNGFGSNVTISDERDAVLETGGGLMKTKEYFDEEEPFILMNVDILTDMLLDKMIEQHNSSKALATLAVTTRRTKRYLLFNDLDILCGWRNTDTAEQKIGREAPKYFQKAFSGIHILSPKIFSLINNKGKFSIMVPYMELCKTHVIRAFDHSNSKLIDTGTPESLKKAEKIFV